MIENIYMIAAITENTHAIGKNGDMIYHLKNDLRYFKETTLGHTIVCGKKTYFSFPKRPLPNRKNIILTRSNDEFDGAYTLHSKEEVIQYANNNPEETIFIVGGDSVYHQFIDVASKLYITEVEEIKEDTADADSFFPTFDKDEWELESLSDFSNRENEPKYRYAIYRRK
ncbi:dihydrofolate reductase [Helcococcus kunzii]|uniref:dihydrofolate reductase n=1 Tax=Helcococcus kunzii TaxID=40091 RepID=UPI001BAE62FF|nr:dihydrofolate reductase [Helcococcus kunzii]QUY64963.1 dihydrofolate reductase [Helcococcus kunzii]